VISTALLAILVVSGAFALARIRQILAIPNDSIDAVLRRDALRRGLRLALSLAGISIATLLVLFVRGSHVSTAAERGAESGKPAGKLPRDSGLGPVHIVFTDSDGQEKVISGATSIRPSVRHGLDYLDHPWLFPLTTADIPKLPNTIISQDVTFKLIPGGENELGCSQGDRDCRIDEPPPRRIRVLPFYITATEITNDQYRQCVDAKVCEAPYDGDGRYKSKNYTYEDRSKGDHPLTWVNAGDAAAFCAWLSGATLPYDYQWEYAARGGLLGTRYPNGDAMTHTVANYARKEDDRKSVCTAPVASFPPNQYGLYDMAGNVAEWVNATYGTEDGVPQLGVRGGACDDDERDIRVTARQRRRGSVNSADVGFRCVFLLAVDGTTPEAASQP
jgi:formylglycine-generating enzyme